MKFWDSSALVPLILAEVHSDSVAGILGEDDKLCVWWGTSLECLGAIWGAHRRERVTELNALRAEARLDEFRLRWTEIQASEELRAEAERALRVHDLRSADALQLASAIVAQRQLATALPFVCLDRRLTQAAIREGFRTTPGNHL